jgi:gluconolactonase
MNRILFLLTTCGIAAMCMGQGIVSLPASLADSAAGVEGVKVGLAYCEGPAVDKDGTVFFTEMSAPQMNVWKVSPTGEATVFRSGVYFNGNEYDPQGRLVLCEQDKLTRLNKAGTFDTLSKTGDNGFALLQTNDLSIATSGALFFTNHSSGKSLFYRSPAGVLKQWTNLPTPNGVEWIEEKGFLYLSLSDTNMVMTFSVGADGSISNMKKFVAIPVPDGITIDEQYNVYVASYQEGRVYVYDSTGQTLGIITVQGSSKQPGNVSNCVFGGVYNKTLYITGNGGLYKVQMKVGGRVRGGGPAKHHK